MAAVVRQLDAVRLFCPVPMAGGEDFGCSDHARHFLHVMAGLVRAVVADR
jgi:hypothetical protein